MPARPFLKWAGGKTQLLPKLLKHIPQNFNNYFEPFIGGGALFFALGNRLQGKNTYINDINPTLVGTYQNIKQNAQKLITELKQLEQQYHQKTKEEQQSLYYEIRKKYNNKALSSNQIQKSTYFLFLNKTGYNGMYRENAKGEFNIPFGRYKNPTICDEQTIREDAKVLQNATFLNTSFENAVMEAKAGDFIYFDPPYHPLSKTANFTNYHETGFSEKEQQLLKQTFVTLDKKGCYVLLSNSYAEFIQQLYKEYKQTIVQANRFINRNPNGRGKMNELIISNYE